MSDETTTTRPDPDMPISVDPDDERDLPGEVDNGEDDLPFGEDDPLGPNHQPIDDDGYFTEDLEQPLSDEQLKVVAHELATTIRERGRVKAEMAETAKRYRDQIAGLDTQVDRKVVMIETCKQRVPVKCRRVAHPDRPFWQYVRTDTGVVYDEEPMSENEAAEQRQLGLPISTAVPHGAAPAGHAGPGTDEPIGSSPGPACVTGDPPGPPIGILRALFPQEHAAKEPDAIIEVGDTAKMGGESYTTLRCRDCGAIAEIRTARYQEAIKEHLAAYDKAATPC